MLLKVDCIPCILSMTIKSLRRLPIAESKRETLFKEILTLPGLSGENWNLTSPDIIEIIMNKIYHTLKNTDPFRDEKQILNEKVQQMEPFAKDLINASPDPVYTAAKLAILGNSIDFMMPGGTKAIEDYIQTKLCIELVQPAYQKFRRQLLQSDKIIYFTDNCGEIVFDKWFIQTLKQHFKIDVTVVTRRFPTLNDATKKEALAAGLAQVAAVIDNGIDGPLPGTVLSRCSQTVQKKVEQADLIIAKGGGNFDSLEEQLKRLDTNITFMLLSKCDPINAYFSTKLHQPIIASFYQHQPPLQPNDIPV